jgi:alginate O-acetyltransferase complex protein AlgI
MVFTSHFFLFYFLPSVLVLYYLLPRAAKNLFLTIASYLFYGWWKPWFVSLMLISTFVDFWAGRAMSAPEASPHRRKLALLFSMCSNLGLLAVFKYAMLAQSTMNDILLAVGQPAFDVWRITLPVGISFYTFQTMSYTIDVYRRQAPPVRSFADFACFVALFPQLVAGPIVRYNTIAEQLAFRTHTLERFSSGALLFMLGFAKKILLANPLGNLADAAFSAGSPPPLTAWAGIMAYAFQIYFDFSGYSDMAVGLGRMLGFEFLKNFDSPYLSKSITEFWRRWHISLSTFLRDYLYIPLGGNRASPRRTYLNLAIVMLLGGLWHGAAWQFAVWGALHGGLLAFERLLGKRSLYAFFPGPVRIGFTFALVLLTWVPFRAPTLSAAVAYWSSMFGLGEPLSRACVASGVVLSGHGLIMLALAILVAFQKRQAWDMALRPTWPGAIFGLFFFVLAVAAMFAQAFNPFLYFQF